MAAVKQLVEDIAKALVDSPDQVSVHAVEGEQITVLELRVAAGDVGKNELARFTAAGSILSHSLSSSLAFGNGQALR